jgi:hypothetical protein
VPIGREFSSFVISTNGTEFYLSPEFGNIYRGNPSGGRAALDIVVSNVDQMLMTPHVMELKTYTATATEFFVYEEDNVVYKLAGTSTTMARTVAAGTANSYPIAAIATAPAASTQALAPVYFMLFDGTDSLYISHDRSAYYVTKLAVTAATTERYIGTGSSTIGGSAPATLTRTSFEVGHVTQMAFVSSRAYLVWTDPRHNIIAGCVMGTGMCSVVAGAWDTRAYSTCNSSCPILTTKLVEPNGIASYRSLVYFLESQGTCLRRFTYGGSVIDTVAGTCGFAGSSWEQRGSQVAMFGGQRLVADSVHETIYIVGAVECFARQRYRGTEIVSQGHSRIAGVVYHQQLDRIFFADAGNNAILSLPLAANRRDPNRMGYAAPTAATVLAGLSGAANAYQDGTGTLARFAQPRYVVYSHEVPNVLYVQEVGRTAGPRAIQIDPSVTTTLLSSTPSSGYTNPWALAVAGHVLHSVDRSSKSIFAIDVSSTSRTGATASLLHTIVAGSAINSFTTDFPYSRWFYWTDDTFAVYKCKVSSCAASVTALFSGHHDPIVVADSPVSASKWVPAFAAGDQYWMTVSPSLFGDIFIADNAHSRLHAVQPIDVSAESTEVYNAPRTLTVGTSGCSTFRTENFKVCISDYVSQTDKKLRFVDTSNGEDYFVKPSAGTPTSISFNSDGGYFENGNSIQWGYTRTACCSGACSSMTMCTTSPYVKMAYTSRGSLRVTAADDSYFLWETDMAFFEYDVPPFIFSTIATFDSTVSDGQYDTVGGIALLPADHDMIVGVGSELRRVRRSSVGGTLDGVTCGGGDPTRKRFETDDPLKDTTLGTLGVSSNTGRRAIAVTNYTTTTSPSNILFHRYMNVLLVPDEIRFLVIDLSNPQSISYDHYGYHVAGTDITQVNRNVWRDAGSRGAQTPVGSFTQLSDFCWDGMARTEFWGVDAGAFNFYKFALSQTTDKFTVTIVAGNTASADTDGVGTAARFVSPRICETADVSTIVVDQTAATTAKFKLVDHVNGNTATKATQTSMTVTGATWVPATGLYIANAVDSRVWRATFTSTFTGWSFSAVSATTTGTDTAGATLAATSMGAVAGLDVAAAWYGGLIISGASTFAVQQQDGSTTLVSAKYTPRSVAVGGNGDVYTLEGRNVFRYPCSRFKACPREDHENDFVIGTKSRSSAITSLSTGPRGVLALYVGRFAAVWGGVRGSTLDFGATTFTFAWVHHDGERLFCLQSAYVKVVSLSNPTTPSVAIGDGTTGSTDGTGAAARVSGPLGGASGAGTIVFGAGSTYAYIADTGNNRIRRLTVNSATYAIAVFIGDGTASTTAGTGVAAKIKAPQKIAVSADYRTIYAVDGDGKLVSIDITSPTTTTIILTILSTAGNTGAAATTDSLGAGFHGIPSLAVLSTGNLVIVDATRVRVIDSRTGAATTILGQSTSGSTDGYGLTTALLPSDPTGIAVTLEGDLVVGSTTAGARVIPCGNRLLPCSTTGFQLLNDDWTFGTRAAWGPLDKYLAGRQTTFTPVADGAFYALSDGHDTITKILIRSGEALPVGGSVDRSNAGADVDSIGSYARLNSVITADIHRSSNTIYFFEKGKIHLRAVRLDTFSFSTVTSSSALLEPRSLRFVGDGIALVADSKNCQLFHLDLTSAALSGLTIAASDAFTGTALSCVVTNGRGSAARHYYPTAIVVSANLTFVYVAELYAIRKVIVSSMDVQTIFGTGTVGSADGFYLTAAFGGVVAMTELMDGNLLVLDGKQRELVHLNTSDYVKSTLTIPGSVRHLWRDIHGVPPTGGVDEPYTTANLNDAFFETPGLIALPEGNIIVAARGRLLRIACGLPRLPCATQQYILSYRAMSCGEGFDPSTSCATCLSGYFGYPKCRKECTIADDCSGNAFRVSTLTTGNCLCSCAAGHTGTACETLAGGFQCGADSQELECPYGTATTGACIGRSTTCMAHTTCSGSPYSVLECAALIGDREQVHRGLCEWRTVPHSEASTACERDEVQVGVCSSSYAGGCNSTSGHKTKCCMAKPKGCVANPVWTENVELCPLHTTVAGVCSFNCDPSNYWSRVGRLSGARTGLFCDGPTYVRDTVTFTGPCELFPSCPTGYAVVGFDRCDLATTQVGQGVGTRVHCRPMRFAEVSETDCIVVSSNSETYCPGDRAMTGVCGNGLEGTCSGYNSQVRCCAVERHYGQAARCEAGFTHNVVGNHANIGPGATAVNLPGKYGGGIRGNLLWNGAGDGARGVMYNPHSNRLLALPRDGASQPLLEYDLETEEAFVLISSAQYTRAVFPVSANSYLVGTANGLDRVTFSSDHSWSETERLYGTTGASGTFSNDTVASTQTLAGYINSIVYCYQQDLILFSMAGKRGIAAIDGATKHVYWWAGDGATLPTTTATSGVRGASRFDVRTGPVEQLALWRDDVLAFADPTNGVVKIMSVTHNYLLDTLGRFGTPTTPADYCMHRCEPDIINFGTLTGLAFDPVEPRLFIASGASSGFNAIYVFDMRSRSLKRFLGDPATTRSWPTNAYDEIQRRGLTQRIGYAHYLSASESHLYFFDQSIRAIAIRDEVRATGMAHDGSGKCVPPNATIASIADVGSNAPITDFDAYYLDNYCKKVTQRRCSIDTDCRNRGVAVLGTTAASCVCICPMGVIGTGCEQNAVEAGWDTLPFVASPVRFEDIGLLNYVTPSTTSAGGFYSGPSTAWSIVASGNSAVMSHRGTGPTPSMGMDISHELPPRMNYSSATSLWGAVRLNGLATTPSTSADGSISWTATFHADAFTYSYVNDADTLMWFTEPGCVRTLDFLLKEVVTVAGTCGDTSSAITLNVPGLSAKLKTPRGVAMGAGGTLYALSTGASPAYVIAFNVSAAYYATGIATVSESTGYGLVADGPLVFFVAGCSIYKLDLPSSVVSTFYGGSCSTSLLMNPKGLAIMNTGDLVVSNQHALKVISTNSSSSTAFVKYAYGTAASSGSVDGYVADARFVTAGTALVVHRPSDTLFSLGGDGRIVAITSDLFVQTIDSNLVFTALWLHEGDVWGYTGGSIHSLGNWSQYVHREVNVSFMMNVSLEGYEAGSYGAMWVAFSSFAGPLATFPDDHPPGQVVKVAFERNELDPALARLAAPGGAITVATRHYKPATLLGYSLSAATVGVLPLEADFSQVNQTLHIHVSRSHVYVTHYTADGVAVPKTLTVELPGEMHPVRKLYFGTAFSGGASVTRKATLTNVLYSYHAVDWTGHMPVNMRLHLNGSYPQIVRTSYKANLSPYIQMMPRSLVSVVIYGVFANQTELDEHNNKFVADFTFFLVDELTGGTYTRICPQFPCSVTLPMTHIGVHRLNGTVHWRLLRTMTAPVWMYIEVMPTQVTHLLFASMPAFTFGYTHKLKAQIELAEKSNASVAYSPEVFDFDGSVTNLTFYTTNRAIIQPKSYLGYMFSGVARFQGLRFDILDEAALARNGGFVDIWWKASLTKINGLTQYKSKKVAYTRVYVCNVSKYQSSHEDRGLTWLVADYARQFKPRLQAYGTSVAFTVLAEQVIDDEPLTGLYPPRCTFAGVTVVGVRVDPCTVQCSFPTFTTRKQSSLELTWPFTGRVAEYGNASLVDPDGDIVLQIGNSQHSRTISIYPNTRVTIPCFDVWIYANGRFGTPAALQQLNSTLYLPPSQELLVTPPQWSKHFANQGTMHIRPVLGTDRWLVCNATIYTPKIPTNFYDSSAVPASLTVKVGLVLETTIPAGQVFAGRRLRAAVNRTVEVTPLSTVRCLNADRLLNSIAVQNVTFPDCTTADGSVWNCSTVRIRGGLDVVNPPGNVAMVDVAGSLCPVHQSSRTQTGPRQILRDSVNARSPATIRAATMRVRGLNCPAGNSMPIKARGDTPMPIVVGFDSDAYVTSTGKSAYRGQLHSCTADHSGSGLHNRRVPVHGGVRSERHADADHHGRQPAHAERVDHSSHGTHLQVLDSRAVPEFHAGLPDAVPLLPISWLRPVLARRNHRVRVRCVFTHVRFARQRYCVVLTRQRSLLPP